MRFTRKLRTQLVLLFICIFGLLFSLFAAGTYRYFVRIHEQEFDAALFNYAVDVSHSLEVDELFKGHLSDDLALDTDMILPFSLGETLLQITDFHAQRSLRSMSLEKKALPQPVAPLSEIRRRGGAFENIELLIPDDESGDTLSSYRMVSLTFTSDLKRNYVIQVAVPTKPLLRQRQRLALFLGTAIPVMLLFASIAGFFFSRRAIAPVERNFAAQEAFIADASHQLKTPLAILKGELEVFRKQSRTPEELTGFLDSAHDEIDSLGRIVEQLLLLARVESPDASISRLAFRLDEKLMETVERYSSLAQAHRVNLNIDLTVDPSGQYPQFEMTGDPGLIRVLIDNLVDNALKYTPQGGQIALRLSQLAQTQTFRLEIQDSGPGISPTALPYIFDRFYRAEATQNTTTGSGLGLSLVKKIAEFHGGNVNAVNPVTGGALFSVEIKSF